MCYTIPYGRQRILYDDEQKFFVDGEAGSQDATAKKRPCHERRAILYKTGTAPGQGRCRNAYGKAGREGIEGINPGKNTLFHPNILQLIKYQDYHILQYT